MKFVKVTGGVLATQAEMASAIVHMLNEKYPVDEESDARPD